MTEITVSRRERKKEETRQRIFEAAIKLFRERGFENATVDEICVRADVAKGTFFNYFPRKEAVLSYLSEQRLEDIEARGDALFADPQPAREKLLALYAHAASAYESDRELTRFVLGELLHQQFGPAQETGRRWDAILDRIFEQGQQSGELRRDVDRARAIELMTSVYYGLLYLWANCEETQVPLEHELRERLTLVLDGLAVPRGGSR